jgi:UbiD family decarboxylase
LREKSVTFRNLQSFIHALHRDRQIIEVNTPVHAHLEIAEIHRRVIAAGGPALLFNHVINQHGRSSFPVVTNLFGTKERVEKAFGHKPQEFIRAVAALPHELMPPSLGKLWGLRGLGMQALKIGFKRSRNAAVLQKEIAGADLTKLPAITSWSEDGGPFLTLPLVHTHLPKMSGGDHHKKPDNLGMYRIQIHDAHETGMHFQIGKGGGFHFFEAEKNNASLPVNIYLGGPPALILSAIAPLPENVPEMLLTSLLVGERLLRGRWRDAKNTAPMPVAEAEFCLTGMVLPNIRRPEGPFGDHYGYYSLRHDYPVFRPRHIYHRPGAVFPATVVGKPRQEDFFLGDYLQELLSPLFPVVMPAVVDLWSYGETGYHSLAGAVLKERYDREALSSVFRILGEGQLSLTKFVLGIDKKIDLRNFRAVLTHVLERADWSKDLIVFANASMDTLDYTGPAVNKGSKGVILGLGEPLRALPNTWNGSLPAGLAKHAVVFSPGCLVVEGLSYHERQDAPALLAKHQGFREWPLVVLVDDAAKTVRTEASFLWTTFTRFEPAADIYSANTTLIRNKISYEGPIVIDARKKPWYPDELFCDPKTAATVSKRWTEYFPDGKVPMGSSDHGHMFG